MRLIPRTNTEIDLSTGDLFDRNEELDVTCRDIIQVEDINDDMDEFHPYHSYYFCIVSRSRFRKPFGPYQDDRTKYLRTMWNFMARVEGGKVLDMQKAFPKMILRPISSHQRGFIKNRDGSVEPLETAVYQYRGAVEGFVIPPPVGYPTELEISPIGAIPVLYPTEFYTERKTHLASIVSLMRRRDLRGEELFAGDELRFHKITEHWRFQTMNEITQQSFNREVVPISFSEGIHLHELARHISEEGFIPMVESVMLIYDSSMGAVNFQDVVPSFSNDVQLIVKELTDLCNRINSAMETVMKFMGAVRLYYHYHAAFDDIWIFKGDNKRMIHEHIPKYEIIEDELRYHITMGDEIAKSVDISDHYYDGRF